jgi:hypothetical protein
MTTGYLVKVIMRILINKVNFISKSYQFVLPLLSDGFRSLKRRDGTENNQGNLAHHPTLIAGKLAIPGYDPRPEGGAFLRSSLACDHCEVGATDLDLRLGVSLEVKPPGR